jgi:hypothetical protein
MYCSYRGRRGVTHTSAQWNDDVSEIAQSHLRVLFASLFANCFSVMHAEKCAKAIQRTQHSFVYI